MLRWRYHTFSLFIPLLMLPQKCKTFNFLTHPYMLRWGYQNINFLYLPKLLARDINVKIAMYLHDCQDSDVTILAPLHVPFHTSLQE